MYLCYLFYKGLKGFKVVVDGFSLNIYKGQIIVLFGYNGVGKIIIMFILIGFFLFFVGFVYINGKSIFIDMEGICESLGFCF